MSGYEGSSAQRRLQALHQQLVGVPGGSGVRGREVCGIVAFVGQQGDEAAQFLLQGLKILESRGYDSAGISTVDETNKRIVTTKYASTRTTSDAIARLEQNLSAHGPHSSVGIAHTRWATHGGKTDQNAHPHVDMSGRYAVVHNGIIDNSTELRRELEASGVVFQSETDTEVIVQLLGHLARTRSLSTRQALDAALQRLEGTYGIVIMDRDDPQHLWAAVNGSPLLVGIGKNRMYLASEASAFNQYTKEFIALNNGEVAELSSKSHSLDSSRVLKAEEEHISTSPAPFPNWTIKEISEQPEAIARTLNFGARILDESSVKLGGLEDRQTELLRVQHLVIAACGTSYYAGLFGSLLMRLLQSFMTVQVVDAAELTVDSFPRSQDGSYAHSGLLVISQSGETKDVHRAMVLADQCGLTVFAVVNAVGSLISRTASCGVYLHAGREHAVASTKAFACQVTALSMIAVWFAQKRSMDARRRSALVNALHRLPTNFGMALGSTVRERCRTVAAAIFELQPKSLFVLGRGLAFPIALEGALKIKEISYLHAEGYSGGALKHGPYALIEPKTPIIMVVLDDDQAHFMKSAISEVRSREAEVFVITNMPKSVESLVPSSHVISVPQNGVLSALVAAIPLQLIAYELSIMAGNNPDRPRNLAKAITVD